MTARRLRLHEERPAVTPARAGRTFVGYRTWAGHRLLRAASVRAFLRRLRWMKRAYAKRRANVADIQTRLWSWLGHAGQGDTRRLVRRLARSWLFRRIP